MGNTLVHVSCLLPLIVFIQKTPPIIWIISLVNYPNFVIRVQLPSLRPEFILTILFVNLRWEFSVLFYDELNETVHKSQQSFPWLKILYLLSSVCVLPGLQTMILKS